MFRIGSQTRSASTRRGPPPPQRVGPWFESGYGWHGITAALCLGHGREPREAVFRWRAGGGRDRKRGRVGNKFRSTESKIQSDRKSEGAECRGGGARHMHTHPEFGHGLPDVRDGAVEPGVGEDQDFDLGERDRRDGPWGGEGGSETNARAHTHPLGPTTLKQVESPDLLLLAP